MNNHPGSRLNGQTRTAPFLIPGENDRDGLVRVPAVDDVNDLSGNPAATATVLLQSRFSFGPPRLHGL